MPDRIRIALAQINLTVGDLSHNLEKIIDFGREAEVAGADIVVYPELALCGYPPEDLLLKKAFHEDIEKSLRKLRRERLKPIQVIGYPHRNKTGLNSAAIIHDGKRIARVDKFCLPNYGVFDEKRYFSGAQKAMIFDLGKIRFGVNICEDIWVSPGITEVLTLHGAQLVINISSSPYHIHKNKVRQDMIRRIVRSNYIYFAYCNLVGGQDELVFDGNSMVFMPDGELLAAGKAFEEDLVVADILPSAVTKRMYSFKIPTQLPKVEEVKLEQFKPSRKRKKKPYKLPEPLKPEQEVFDALVLGLRDYVGKNGFSEVVVGLSGGIDSALTAAVAEQALGRNHLHLVFMPSEYTSKQSIRDARKLAKNMEVDLIEISIDEPFAHFKALLSEQFAGLKEDITEENLQARIRGNILMALSNKFSWMVLTTGNKSEVSVGYFTIYGDSAGGFAVLKDVYKTLVFQLARYYNRMRGKTVIPRSIINKPPSAELRPDQKDTDSLPPYEKLDPILKMYIESDMGQREIVNAGYERKLVRRIIRLVDMSEYKRRQSPPGIKITPRAFGRDRRMPITQKYF